MQSGLEHAGPLATRLLLAVTGDLLEGRIDRDDATVGIAHQNGFGEVVIDPVGELELLRMAPDGIDVLQHHHEIVGVHLLVADQGHRHPPPQDGPIPMEITLLLSKRGTLSPLEGVVERNAGLPVVRMVDFGDGELLQLLLAVAEHLLDGRVRPEDLAAQIHLADAHGRMGHHGVQEVVMFRLRRLLLALALLIHQRQFTTGERGQQTQQAHYLLHSRHGPLEHDAAQADGLSLGVLERDAGIGSHLAALQHGGVGEQLAGAITEPGFTLLHGDLARSVGEGEAVGVDVEGGGIGGMHGKEQTRLILAGHQDEVSPHRVGDFTHKGIKISLTTRMRQAGDDLIDRLECSPHGKVLSLPGR